MPFGAGFIGAGAFPYAVVLQAAINVVGFGHVYGDGVELTHGRRIALDPGFAVVVGNVETAVVAKDEMSRAFGADPEVVVIHVYVVAVDVFKSFPAVFGTQHRNAIDIHFLRIIRRHAHLTEVVAVGIVHIIQVAFMRFLPGSAFVV